MSRFSRFLAWWFPSVPPAAQARALAAMENRDYEAPAVGAWGSASAAGGTTHAPTSLGDQVGRGVETASERLDPAKPPACETDLFWEPKPINRWDLTTGRLAALVDRWTKEIPA